MRLTTAHGRDTSHQAAQVDEKVPLLQAIPLSFQHLFAMFGASVLVPTLFGIDPAVVLFMNGIGTLIYLVLCKGNALATVVGMLLSLTFYLLGRLGLTNDSSQ